MATFSQFLNSFEPETKGRQFEVFVKWFLKNDPEWSTQLDQIWLWDEYPDRWGPDCGIDLVFKHKNSEIWAVQAKCYSQEYSISKKDVDTFLSESNRAGIDKRLLIASTDLIGANARRTCENQEKDVVHFLYSDFEKAEIEYPENFLKLNSTKRRNPPKARPHQSEALDAVEKGFTENDRGQLLMACGTGKTFTTLWIKERIKAQSTLVLVPSLSLLSQTLREWTFAANESFDVLCVCSDETVGKKSGHDEIIKSVHDISFPVTSNVEEIKSFLQGSGKQVIFSTYQSSPIIAQAQRGNNAKIFDLVISDEAHRCTGEAGSAFTTVLDDTLIKARRRLFATATPKTYTANLKKSAEERGVEITGMDDEAVFGKVFYSLPFGEAIKRELLTDYQVVIIGVDQPMIAEWIENRELLLTASGEATDAESLAAQIGLFKAMKDYDLKRIISFQSRIKRAEIFATDIQNSIDFISKKQRPKGTVWTDFVSGKMSAHKRKTKLDQLKDLSQGERGLLSNARCLSEGVDVPALDGVAFIDPKGSQVDIIQAVGRAIRLSQEKSVGTIFLPVFIQHGDDVESSILSSNFKPVWNVLNALKSHDDVLSVELDQMRTNLGRKYFQGKIIGIPKVILDLPQTIDKSFADSLKTVLVEQTTSSWNFWFGLLEDYVDKEGHARVKDKFKTEVGYNLGSWVGIQRAKKEQLSFERKSRLERLGFDWSPNDTDWDIGFSHLEKFYQIYGHARVTRGYLAKDGYKLSSWVLEQRQNKKSGKLIVERESRLDYLGFDWDPNNSDWEVGFSHFEKFVDNYGHPRVPIKSKTKDGFTLGNWVSVQRRAKSSNILTTDRASRLDALEFDWDPVNTHWEMGFSHLEKFVEIGGHGRVPRKYITKNGFKLGVWSGSQRKLKDKLSPEKRARLDSLGIDWDPHSTAWENGFFHFEKYVKIEGHSRVPIRFESEDGFFLGRWVRHQRIKENELTPDQKARLVALYFDWEPNRTYWENGFSHLKKYVQQEGHSRIPYSFESEDGYKLSSWIIVQRQNKDQLIPEQKSLLDSIGFDWDPRNTQWENGCNHLEIYFKQEGHVRVPASYKSTDGFTLGSWVSVQRGKKGQLSPEQRSRLDALDFDLDPINTRWEEGFSHFEKFFEIEGHGRVPSDFITKDGFKLGVWSGSQRHRKDRLSLTYLARLNSLGFDWDPINTQWETCASLLEKFVEEQGHAVVPEKFKTEDGLKLGFWVRNIRTRSDQLTPERKSRLDALGFVWKVK